MSDDDDIRRLIDPELQIALANLAERMHRRQDMLPLWAYELLERYGEACAAKAIRWMHERKTQRPPSQPMQIVTIPAPPPRGADWDHEDTPVVELWDDGDGLRKR